MQTIDQLIHAKWIITCDEQNRVLEDHAIAIHDNKILAILPSQDADKAYQATSQASYPSHAIMPGFFNSHTHTSMVLFRGLADDLELMDWLNDYIWPIESKLLSEEMVYDASLISMAEMIRSGTICFNDMYFFPGATAKAAELAGLRAGIGMTIINVPTAWAKTTDDYFAKAVDFFEQYKSNPLITPTMAPHSTYTVTLAELERAHALATKFKLKTNIHLQEAPSEMENAMAKLGKRPLKLLDEIGYVGPDLIAIHMTQVNDADLEIIGEKRPNIVHCPESNMKLDCGFCPVETLTNMGINVALGTDGAASNNDLDMVSETRSAAFLGKVAANDPKAVSAQKALTMATINGAKALGLGEVTGSLVAGKSADFIAIDLGQIETQPLYHPVSQIVYAASRNLVTDVWVCGRQLLKDRKLLTLDEKELLAKAQKWGKLIKNSL